MTAHFRLALLFILSISNVGRSQTADVVFRGGKVLTSDAKHTVAEAVAVKADRIVDEAVIHFRQWYESLDVVPTIVAIRNKLETLAEAEVKKTLQANKLPNEHREALERMAGSLVNKILHDPTKVLKNRYHEDKSVLLDITRKLFNLDDET